MKKLVYYSDCFVFGGCEKLLLNLITSRKVNERFEVHYAYARNSDYQKGVERDVPVSVRRNPLPILSNHNLFYRLDRSRLNRFVVFCLKIPFALLDRIGIYAGYNFLALFYFFTKIRPDLLHINNGGYPAARSCLVAVASARAAGVPKIVFTVNNLAENQNDFIDKIIDRYINLHVDRFVTASSLAGRLLTEKRGFSAAKVVQIFNGIPTGAVEKNRSELLASFGVSVDKFVITSVALLTERKGQMYLLQALAGIKRSGRAVFDDIVLFLVGDGEDRAAIESYINANSLQGSVILVGHRDDFFDFIHAADLFVLPSLRNEDMPLVILSAMSSARAIVATRVAGMVEQIRDGIDGILIEPADADALAAAITRFYHDRPFAAACGERARERFLDCFSLDRFVANYLELYLELADEQHYQA